MAAEDNKIIERASDAARSFASTLGWNSVRVIESTVDPLNEPGWHTASRHEMIRNAPNSYSGFTAGSYPKSVEVWVRLPLVEMTNEANEEDYAWDDIFFVSRFVLVKISRKNEQGGFDLIESFQIKSRLNQSVGVHPHIQADSDCLGDYRGLIEDGMYDEDYVTALGYASLAANTYTPEDVLNSDWGVDEEGGNHCDACDEQIGEDGWWCDDVEQYCCEYCCWWCDECEERHSSNLDSNTCDQCDDTVCDEHKSYCGDCDRTICNHCVGSGYMTSMECCNKWVCDNCFTTCSECLDSICKECKKGDLCESCYEEREKEVNEREEEAKQTQPALF